MTEADHNIGSETIELALEPVAEQPAAPPAPPVLEMNSAGAGWLLRLANHMMQNPNATIAEVMLMEGFVMNSEREMFELNMAKNHIQQLEGAYVRERADAERYRELCRHEVKVRYVDGKIVDKTNWMDKLDIDLWVDDAIEARARKGGNDGNQATAPI